MQVVTTNSASPQYVYFIPRVSSIHDMYLTDESTNVTQHVAIIQYTHGQYTDRIQALFHCKEGHYYRWILKDGAGNEVHRDRIFCTNQLPANYTPNSSTYTVVQGANEFLMY